MNEKNGGRMSQGRRGLKRRMKQEGEWRMKVEKEGGEECVGIGREEDVGG